MALSVQEQKIIDQVLRNAPITNRARDILRKLYLIAESDVYTVHLTKENKSLPTTTAGVVTYTDSGTTISVYRGDTQLTGITSGTPTVGQFKVTATDTNITAGAQSVTDTYNITFANSSDITAAAGDISFSINVENVSTFVKVFHLIKSPQGATGATGATGDTGATGAAGADAYNNHILDLQFIPAAHFTVNAAQSAWYKDSDGANGYNAHFYSNTEFDERCYCSFVWDGTPAGRMKIGISSSAKFLNGAESLIEVYNAGGWKGRIVQTGTTNTNFGGVTAGDRFSLRYDGTKTTFFQNGIEVVGSALGSGSFLAAGADGDDAVNIGGWMFTGSIFTAGAGNAQITDVIFLPQQLMNNCYDLRPENNYLLQRGLLC